jgi:hypothetical protein
MANIFVNWLNNTGDWFAAKLATYLNDQMGMAGGTLTDYYNGDHRPQLKRVEGKQDDNIMQNFIGLAVDRSVSRLFQGGVDFELPDGSTAQDEYLNRVWDLNKKEIILYQVGLFGAVHGTCYMKIQPNELEDPYKPGKFYPKLTPINPRTIRIKTHPEDMNMVREYVIQYACKEERDGRVVDVIHKEVTKRNEVATESVAVTWTVEHWEQVGGAQMVMIDSILWDYDFPPIIHWKNLPSLETCYGDSEIDDVINVQDKSNFVTSNTGKIIKFHAHPHTIVTGSSAKSAEPIDTGPSAMTAFPSAEAKVFNLEMQSDLESSRAFGKDLRQSIFDIAREVDITSIHDKLGALTNFALRVLYSDALQKNDTKRQLYGDALLELNRRLLVLANYTGEQSNPGTIAWGEALPSNILEEMQTDQMALDMGVVDKETVFKRYEQRYGVEWETVQANIQKQQPTEREMKDEIMSDLQRNGQESNTERL